MGNSIRQKWETAFNNYGTSSASDSGVSSCVGSDAFSFPILATEVLYSIELAIIISIAGFFGLLVFFTSFDIGIIILGTIGMIAIFAVTICLHIYFFNAIFDLIDVVVLIAIIGIVVDSPIHVIIHYLQERRKYSLLKTRKSGDEEEGANEEQKDELN